MLVDNIDKHNSRALKQRDSDRAHFLKNFQNLIIQYDHIVLFHHTGPDGDCLGAVFGLKELLRENFPNKRVYCVGSNPDNLFSWLNMKFDNSINYDFDFTKAMAVICDVSTSNRIDSFNKFFKTSRFLFGAVVRIDHHDFPADFHVDLTWDDPTYAATCCQIVQISEFYGWRMTPTAATFLYLGICTDSLRFSSSSSIPRSLILAAKAWRAGADYHKIHSNLSKRSWNKIKLSSYILTKAVVSENVIYGVFHKEEATQFGIPSFKSMVSVYANIEECWVWMLFAEYGNDHYEVSMRSVHVPVRGLSMKYGGGGHEFAAGCMVHKDQIEQLVKDAEDMVAKAKQEIYHEESLKVIKKDPESTQRINEAILNKNPALMEEAKQLIDEVKKEREEWDKQQQEQQGE